PGPHPGRTRSGALCVRPTPARRYRAGAGAMSIVLVRVVLDPARDDDLLAVAGVELHHVLHVAEQLDDFVFAHVLAAGFARLANHHDLLVLAVAALVDLLVVIELDHP